MHFIISFYDLGKFMTIVAPNNNLAEQWVEKQLEHWGKESEFDVEEKA